MKNIWETKLPGLSLLGALNGLGVMRSEGIPHAKGAKAAKVREETGEEPVCTFYLSGLGVVP